MVINKQQHYLPPPSFLWGLSFISRYSTSSSLNSAWELPPSPAPAAPSKGLRESPATARPPSQGWPGSLLQSHFCPPPHLPRVHTGLFLFQLAAASSIVPFFPQAGTSCIWHTAVPASPSCCSPGTTPGNRIWYRTLSCIYFSFCSRGWGVRGSLYNCQYACWTKHRAGKVLLFCDACKSF